MAGRFLTALLVATIMLAVAAAGGMAQAQKHDQQKGAGGGGKMGQGMMCSMMGGGAMKGPERMAAMQAGHIAFLKTALGITEAQTGVWNKYVEALKANQGKMGGMMKGKMGAKKDATAIQKLDARIQGTKAKLQNLEAMKPVTEALYKALDAEQKKKADAILLKRCPMM